MSQEEIRCRRCGTINASGSDRCKVCTRVLEVNIDKGTKLLPQEPEVEAGSGNQRKQPLIPRIPSLGSAFQKGTGRIIGKETWFILLVSILVILIILFLPSTYNNFLSQSISRSTLQSTPQPTPTLNVPIGIGQDGIGVTLVDGEYIGISDGRYAFDINRDAGPLMLQASESFRRGEVGPALTEWDAAHEKDTSDAEPLIYREDQRVKTADSPYITIVLGISVHVKKDDGFSRDVLQAAYVVQREYNDNPQLSGGKKLRLLIANSGSNSDHSKDIAKQIVQAAQADKTIVGVQGWTTSVNTLNALPDLVKYHLPVVAADTASDDLTSASPYFFRTGMPSSASASLETNYIEKKLAPQRLVIFRDLTEPYSFGSSKELAQQFMKDNYPIAHVEDFKTGDESALAQHVQSVLATYNPDFIIIATIAVGDVTTVLNTIPKTDNYKDLKVLAGGAGYELVQPGVTFNGYTRMLLSSSAFPDEWSILAPEGTTPPSFFKDYVAAYDPLNQHIKSPYTYRRANGGVMMVYDALSVFLVANKMAIQQGKQNPTPEDIKNTLSQINSSQPSQGITGAIAFGSDGNPINKLHFVLHVVDGGYTRVAAYQGCLLVNSPSCDNNIHILE